MLSERCAKAVFELSSQSDAVIAQAVADFIVHEDEVGVVVV
jgi:hypothetical protein